MRKFSGGGLWQLEEFKEEFRAQMREPFGFLVHRSSVDGPKVLGNVAVIYSGGDVLLGVSVRHMLGEVDKQNTERKYGRFDYLKHLPSDDSSGLYINENDLKAVFWIGEKLIAFDVSYLSAPSIDACVLQLFPQAGARKTEHTGAIGLDLRFPQVDEEVWSLGYSFFTPPENASFGESERRPDGRLRFDIKKGSVVGVKDQRQSVTLGPVFHTTIPFSSGDSGRMIGRPVAGGELISLIGVVSSSWSSDDANIPDENKNFSTVSMIWPSLGFFMNANIESDGVTEQMTIKDFIKEGFIKEVSNTVDMFDILIEENSFVVEYLG